MSATKTCLDCDEPVTGRVMRCPKHHGERDRAKRLARVRKTRARKKAGLPALSPQRPVGVLGTYEHAKQAVAAARMTDDAKEIRDQSSALIVYAARAKDTQLQTDAIEIRVRAERRLGEIIKQQKDTVGLNTGAAGIGKSAVQEDDRTPTLGDAGISKNLSSDAQKLAEISDEDFEDRVDDWRGNIEDGKTQPTIKLLTKKPKPPRKDNDFYPTPLPIILEVCARWKPSKGAIWEPFNGDGRFARALEAVGRETIRGDISTGQDFFDYAEAPSRRLCSNPPFILARKILVHAFTIGVEEMCLVLPERFWASDIGRKQLEENRPSRWINLDWREDYLGVGGSPDRALGIAIWDTPNAAFTRFEVWSRANGAAK